MKAIAVISGKVGEERESGSDRKQDGKVIAEEEVKFLNVTKTACEQVSKGAADLLCPNGFLLCYNMLFPENKM